MCVYVYIIHVFKENGRGKPRVLRMSSPPNPAVNLATSSIHQPEVRLSVNSVQPAERQCLQIKLSIISH